MATPLSRFRSLAAAPTPRWLAVASLGLVLALAGCDRDQDTGKRTSLIHLPKKAASVPDPNSGPTMTDLANADNPPERPTAITNPRQLAGSFDGALPCPDAGCTAVLVHFVMLPDGTFQRTDKLVGGKSDGRSAATAGRWRLGSEGRTIEAGLERPESMVTFAIESANQLRMLDIYGRRIEGADSERYVLRRDGTSSIPAQTVSRGGRVS